MTYAEAATTPTENTTRGTVLALVIIPLGVVAWVAIWNLGYVAGIVGYGIAVGALFLYRFGSGGFVSRGGAVRVLLVTLATVLIALFASVVSDVVNVIASASGMSAIETFTHESFWPTFQALVADEGVIAGYAPQFAIGLGLALLGSFSTLRNAFRQAAPAAQVPTQPVYPAAGYPAEGATAYPDTTYPNTVYPNTVYPSTVYPETAGPGVNGLPQYGEVAPPAAPIDPAEPKKD